MEAYLLDEFKPWREHLEGVDEFLEEITKKELLSEKERAEKA